MIPLNRRNFIKSAALPLIMPWKNLSEASGNRHDEQGPVIKSFTVFKGSGNFNRFIAMNAYDTAPKGITGTKSIVTVLLSDGTVELDLLVTGLQMMPH